MTVPPTSLTRPPNDYWPVYGTIQPMYGERMWEVYYIQGGLRPQVEDGHIVVDEPGLVEIAIFLNIQEIECREFYYDSRPTDFA